MSSKISDSLKATEDEPEFRKAAFSALLAAQASIMLAIFGATFTYYSNIGEDAVKNIIQYNICIFLVLSFIGNMFFASMPVAIMKAQKYLYIENYESEIPPTWHIHKLAVWKFCFREPSSTVPTDNAVHIIASLCVIAIIVNWIFFATITVLHFSFS